MSRRGEFLARHKRPPDASEEAEIRELERADRQQDAAARHERELKLAFLATPGATLEQWEKEKGRILDEDRRQRAIATKDAARASQAALYKAF